MASSPSTKERGISSPSELRFYQEISQSKYPVDIIDIKKSGTFNQCVLGWQNISFSTKPKRSICNFRSKKKPFATEHRILNNLSGRSAPGEVTAILGPSGAGKTTFLDILADRDSMNGVCEGIIEVNGLPRKKETYHTIMNYVAQDSALFGSFTVMETLQIAAALSLPNHIPRVTREIRVQDVIEDMGLRSCARTRVGDVFHEGISHGQRKRLSIAMELLSNPSILLLDEPTSGLDSSSARQVMEYLVRLAKDGKNVICTLHQPSSAVYEMLSNIMILSSGEMVYFGSSDNAIQHFFSQDYICPMYTNPADFFIELVNKDFHAELKLDTFVAEWKASDDYHKLKFAINADRSRHTDINLDVLSVWKPSAWNQFVVLLLRDSLNNVRNPGVFWIRMLMYTLLSLMVGTMYLDSNKKITDTAMVPLLFYLQAFLVFMSVAALPSFIEHRAVFHREARNNSLNVFSFVAANFIAGLPGIFLISLAATATVVWCAGVNTFSSFLLNLFLSLIVAESFMHLLAALVPHYIIGIALGAGFFGMFMLCEGFMVPPESIPGYWKWGYYLAFHSYSFEAFMYEHFSHENTKEAWQVLKSFGMEDVNVGKDMFILVLYAVVLQALFGVALYVFHGSKIYRK